MIAVLARLCNSILWLGFYFLTPLFYTVNVIFQVAAQHSKTVSVIILKARLVRDVVLQSPPPSYQYATKSTSHESRLQKQETSLRALETQLSAKQLALEAKQAELNVDAVSLNQKEQKLREEEQALGVRAETIERAVTDLDIRSQGLDADLKTFKEDEDRLQRLRNDIRERAENIERQESQISITRQRLQEDRQKIEEHGSLNQKRLDERQAEINSLHDRFLRSQLESLEHHRSEHDALVESLKSRLAESQRNLVDEQNRSQGEKRKWDETQSELEQRCAFLTNELAERTDREFNLATELSELRRNLSDERGNFNKEFGELSRALADLKLRCSQYESEIIMDDEKAQRLKIKEEALLSLEKNIVHKREELEARLKAHVETENSLKERLEGLLNREDAVETQEKMLNDKLRDLNSLQDSVQKRMDRVVEAENDLEIRTRGHEDAIETIKFIQEKESQDHHAIPDTKGPDIGTTAAPHTSSSSSSRPTIRERVSRRTSELVERVNTATHRRSLSQNHKRNDLSICSPTSREILMQENN